jgi:hypothetical protein
VCVRLRGPDPADLYGVCLTAAAVPAGQAAPARFCNHDRCLREAGTIGGPHVIVLRKDGDRDREITLAQSRSRHLLEHVLQLSLSDP